MFYVHSLFKRLFSKVTLPSSLKGEIQKERENGRGGGFSLIK